MTLDFSSLNTNQVEAIKWQDGSLLVLAGPGSGKTRVLTFRIARIIEETPGKHFKLLALTFTNKAAAEMRERILDLVPNAGERSVLTTFHSFSADLLRQHGHHIGLKPDFTILVQDADRNSLLDEAIQDSGIDRRYRSEKLLPLITGLIENDISIEEAPELLSKGSFEDPAGFGEVYRRYRELMIAHNTLDFPGLIAEAHRLLKEKVGVRKQIHRVFHYICVDEFQDTNISQYKILRLLVNTSTRNLFVVADDDQIIYQWNGASPERLWEIQKDFDMQLMQLPQNYRCPAAIVELANRLISHNFGRSPKKQPLTAYKKRTDSKVFTLKHFDNFELEASWVARDIASRNIGERAKCVVLARTKKLLERMVESLADQSITAYLAVKKNEFESPSLVWLHAMLRLANARSSRENLRRACKAFFSLEGVDLDVSDIVSKASANDGDYLRAWAATALLRPGLSDGAGELIRGGIFALSERLDFWGFEKDAFKWLDGLPDNSLDITGIFNEYDQEKETWRQLVDEISGQYGRQEVTLHLLLQELDLRSKSPPPPKDAVPCFTIHASKGMEFNHVYLVGLVEDQLPSWAAIKKGDDSREMQEERRNCFVAITRAQETLTLSYSDAVLGWNKMPSRFLEEMGVI